MRKKWPVAYVKSRDGKSWYVGDKPLQLDAEPFQLQGYVYAACEQIEDRSNLERATAYAHCVADEVVIMELGEMRGIRFVD